MRLFHRTTDEAAAAILAEGFRDTTGNYGIGCKTSGVWFSNVPLDSNEGADGDALLEVQLDLPDTAIAEWEWVEARKRYREFEIPAAVINQHATVRLVTDEGRFPPDIHCWRTANGTAECSIEQRHVHHSPTGIEFSYGGSGPADLALNILALAIGPAPDPGPEPDEDSSPDAWEAWAELDDQRVKLWDGSYVHADAWDLHEAFKAELIATMPREGGTIAGAVIEAWIVAHTTQLGESAGVD